MEITVGQMIDTAVRRCGITTPLETPEMLLMAKQRLQATLFDLINRGVSIWQVTPSIQGMEPAKWKYNLDPYTYDIFNLNWRTYNHIQMFITGGTNPQNLNDYNWNTSSSTTNFFVMTVYTLQNDNYQGSPQLDYAQFGPADPNIVFTLYDYPQIVRFGYWGINPVGNQLVSFNIDISPDGINWITVSSYTNYQLIDSQWLWVDLDTPVEGIQIRIILTNSNPEALILRGFFAGDLRNALELVASKQNRDDFFSYPNKGVSGPPINYYFLKDTIPQLQLWQSALAANCFNWALKMYVYYVPPLDMSLPLPLNCPQWYIDGICWLLAEKLVYELPNVSPDRIPTITAQSQIAVNQMEASNADSSPINLLGNALSAYTSGGYGGSSGR